MSMEIRKVKVSDIVVDENLQVRVSIDPSVVNDYAAAYERGDDMPRIVCFEIDGRIHVVSGFTRLAGMKQAEIEEIKVDVIVGTFGDALRYALKANATNGARLTRADKRKAIDLHLRNFPEDSDRVIAKTVGCSPSTVGDVRRKLNEGVQFGQVTKRKGADGKEYTVLAPAKDYQFHEMCSFLSLGTECQNSALRRNIQEHGLRQPIILYEGKILDGRRRYRICKELGIEPEFMDLPEGEDPMLRVCQEALWTASPPEEIRALQVVRWHNAMAEHAGRERWSLEELAEDFEVRMELVRKAEEMQERWPDLADRVWRREKTFQRACIEGGITA